MMMEIKVILDYACCSCGDPVSVTVKCAGKGLSQGARTVASVNVPCPGCGKISQVCFEPSGTVRAVAPLAERGYAPVPSVN